MLRFLLARDERLAIARADADIGKDLLRSEVHGGDVGRLVRDLLLEFLLGVNSVHLWTMAGGMGTYQVVKYTLVELPFCRTALPQLLIPVVETLPVFTELGKAMGVDVLDTRGRSMLATTSNHILRLCLETMAVPRDADLQIRAGVGGVEPTRWRHIE